MGSLNEVAMDMTKASVGVEVEYAAGIKVVVGSANSPKYRKARVALLALHRKAKRRNALSAEQILDLLKPASARHILLNWSGMTEGDGSDDDKEIPYTYEKAMEIFSNPAYNDFFDFVVETSGTPELFSDISLEDSAKN